jgi:hypothetical protein
VPEWNGLIDNGLRRNSALHAEALQRLNCWLTRKLSRTRCPNDPHYMSAQIKPIGVPCPMIGEEPSAAPNGGSRALW